MTGRLSILLLLAGLWLLPPAGAGERIVAGFEPGLPQGREVLDQVPVKVLVAEFIDPRESGLGKSLGYMLWREALTAVHDQRGAGVIYAHTAGDAPLADLLRRDYHLAAVEIARAQRSRVVLWGAVGLEGDRVYIDSYLTLLPELVGHSLSLAVQAEGRALPGLATEIGRSRYGFAQVRYSREALFRRPLVARSKARLHRAPDPSSPVLATIPAGTALQARDMRGGWFRVEHDGGDAWIEIGRVDLPPRRARVDRDRINIRSGPNTPQVLRKADLHGEFPVLASRYVPGSGVWYRLRFDWGSGWVAAWLTEPRFTLPVVHFLAGLQRYQLGNYRQAAAAFQRFIDQAGDAEGNVNLAAAHALLGASLLMADTRSHAARQAIDRAVELTPYDPLVHDLRALAGLALPAIPGDRAVADLATALELDPRNPRSLALLTAVSALARQERPEYRPLRHLFWLDTAGSEQLRQLERLYLKRQSR